jgi:hypothetical protein
MRLSLLPLIVAVAALPACGTTFASSADTLSEDALVSFQYLDASVPPQYHRSYELSVTASRSRLVVDSYGEVLADEQVPTSPEVWEALGTTLGQVTDLPAEAGPQGCTGGTVTSLTVLQGSDASVDVVLDECAGENADSAARVTEWIAPALAQFPSIDQLAPEGP